MKVLDFASNLPHETGRLRCDCGHVAQHVWPSATALTTLECPKCHGLGLSLAPGWWSCAHDPKSCEWYRTVGDSDTIDTSQPFCVRCELTRLQTLADRFKKQALEISETLRDAGIGPCTLPEGVRELAGKVEEYTT